MISSIDKIRIAIEDVQAGTGMTPVKAEMSRDTMYGLEFDHITSVGVIGFSADVAALIGMPIQRNDAIESGIIRLIYKSSAYAIRSNGLIQESVLVRYVDTNE